MKTDKQILLQSIPKIDKLIALANKDTFFKNIPKSLLLSSIRKTTEKIRASILEDESRIKKKDIHSSAILENVRKLVFKKTSPNLIRTINAAGVVIHTNLGRSLLCKKAVEHILSVADKYSNLEFNLETGKRGSRYSAVEEILCEISGAEAAMVVNNNAAAVLLAIETIASGKETIVSRGELVEIGGSFRIPDIIKKSGSILKSVGTTNRTHLKDYETAINENTALLLKVHKSNYDIIGFTSELSLKEIVELGKKHNICIMDDLGSGTFIDFSEFKMHKEPTVMDAVSSGADIITFSGDKLLGGPQAGIILGKKEIIEEIKKNPLTRALRIDKLTLAALEGTIRLYRDQAEAIKEIPTLAMLTMPFEQIQKRAKRLRRALREIKNSRIKLNLIKRTSRAGGGALCSQELPSLCVGISIEGLTSNNIEKAMRLNSTPIIGTIENNLFLIDLRTVLDDEIKIIKEAVKTLLE